MVGLRDEGEGEGRRDSSVALHDVGVVPESGPTSWHRVVEEPGGEECHNGAGMETVQLSWKHSKNTKSCDSSISQPL